MISLNRIYFALLVFAVAIPVPGADQPGHGKPAAKPLFRDPVYDGAADPTVIWNQSEKKWFMFYTNRRANLTNGVDGVSWVHGTKIGIAESGDGGATWTYRGTADIAYGGEGMTHWAPEVIAHDGTYHMFLTFVPGIFSNWQHPRDILHLTIGPIGLIRPISNNPTATSA